MLGIYEKGLFRLAFEAMRASQSAAALILGGSTPELSGSSERPQPSRSILLVDLSPVALRVGINQLKSTSLNGLNTLTRPRWGLTP